LLFKSELEFPIFCDSRHCISVPGGFLPARRCSAQPGDAVTGGYILKPRPPHQQSSLSTEAIPLYLGTSGPGANVRHSSLGIWAMLMAVLNLWLLSANTALPREAAGAGQPPVRTFSVVNDFSTV